MFYPGNHGGSSMCIHEEEEEKVGDRSIVPVEEDAADAVMR